jgi:hypothetical protein
VGAEIRGHRLLCADGECARHDERRRHEDRSLSHDSGSLHEALNNASHPAFLAITFSEAARSGAARRASSAYFVIVTNTCFVIVQQDVCTDLSISLLRTFMHHQRRSVSGKSALALARCTCWSSSGHS